MKYTATIYRPDGTSRQADAQELARLAPCSSRHNSRLKANEIVAAAMICRRDCDILQSGKTFAAYCHENDMYSDKDRNKAAEQALNEHSAYKWGAETPGYVYGPVLIIQEA